MTVRRNAADERAGAFSRKYMLSVADIVAIYGVSRSFAYGLKRWLPWYRFGGVKFRREDIERFLKSDRRRAARRAPGRDESAEEVHDHELRGRFGFSNARVSIPSAVTCG